MEAIININDYTDNDLKLCIEQIEKTGKTILIFRDNKQIAKVIPQKYFDPFIMDPVLKGAFFVGDPTAPLSESDWPEHLR